MLARYTQSVSLDNVSFVYFIYYIGIMKLQVVARAAYNFCESHYSSKRCKDFTLFAG